MKGIFLGIENLKFEPITAEVWFNELRLSHLDEKGGWAAIGRLDIIGADLFNINAYLLVPGALVLVHWNKK